MKSFILLLDDPRYPALLKEIYDPPPVLHALGDYKALKAPCLAIVGSRQCSTYGEEQAFAFAKELAAKGVCIVSGLAYGIDAAAHEGALAAGGLTIAVVAQYIEDLRPIAHRALANRIVKGGGLILSEKFKGAPSFHQADYLIRNRIISGLSKGTLVVEAGFKSGALNTAKHAFDQNREVMAIPGRISDPFSRGTNRLIADGAGLVASVEDIHKSLGFWPEYKKDKNEVQKMYVANGIIGLDQEIYCYIRNHSPTQEDLFNAFQHPITMVYESLGFLELNGYIQLGKDGRYMLI